LLKLLTVLFLLAQVCWAQQGDDHLWIRERIWMASKIYATVLQYFGHWQAVPDLKLDTAYRQYVDQIALNNDRVTFDLATMEFVAKLRNGHSDFFDPWLWKSHAQPLGFWLDLIDGKWVVRDAQIEGMENGHVVTAIDGRAVDLFVGEHAKYIAASDDRARRAKVFFSGFLWPESFTLTFADGHTLAVNRLQPKPKPRRAPAPAPRLPEGVAYHRIRSFEEPANENAAIAFVKANASAKLIIFDVRNNGEGSSPERLLRALMDRPYRDWMQASAMSFGLFATYGELFRTIPPKDTDARERGYLEAFSEYSERPYFMTPGALKEPESQAYTGPIYVLQNRSCGSACEDFVMPLKTSKRAMIFGERTFGIQVNRTW